VDTLLPQIQAGGRPGLKPRERELRSDESPGPFDRLPPARRGCWRTRGGSSVLDRTQRAVASTIELVGMESAPQHRRLGGPPTDRFRERVRWVCVGQDEAKSRTETFRCVRAAHGPLKSYRSGRRRPRGPGHGLTVALDRQDMYSGSEEKSVMYSRGRRPSSRGSRP